MRALFIALPLIALGCAPLMDAQSELVFQSRRGVEVAQSNSATSASVHSELAKVKRQRLDDAFDADVRERADRAELTAEWVIAARSAYAIALEAQAKQDLALRASDETARRNLEAVDAALQRVQSLQSIQSRWLSPPRPKPEDE